jgi:hypothetical protein
MNEFREAAKFQRQVEELWAHLPAGEIPDDDPTVMWRTDAAGNLLVRTDAAMYRLSEGAGWRLRKGPDGAGVSEWKARKCVEAKIVSNALAEMFFEGNPERN